jgi:glucose/arabinose dehydrogenase/mono/diheme cytochrome c family protein
VAIDAAGIRGHLSRAFVTLGVLACLGASAAPDESHSTPQSKSCPNDDSGLILPVGFCATIFADEIGHARHLTVTPGGVVYVNTWSGEYYGNDTPHAGGFLVALEDASGSGKATDNERFGETVQSGGAGGTGIGLYQGALYAEINDRIVRYKLAPGSIVPHDPPQTVVSGLPLGGDHPMHPFLIDPAGYLYVDIGSATNSCQPQNRSLESPGLKPCTELETRGGIWRFRANETDQKFSPAARFATGLRNAEGFAIDSSGRIFVTQHGRDQLHSNWPGVYKLEQEATLPAEELVNLRQGGDYGWPECYYDPASGKLVLAPEYGGDGHRAGECAGKSAPIAAFPAHWAPDGMVFYDKDQFPVRYRNGVFIAFHGSWNRAPYPQRGYNVVFQKLDGDKAAGRCEIFADGFAGAERSPDKAKHRPTGLAVGPDGSLYISDDVRGRIYRVTYRGSSEASAGARTVACPSASAAPGRIVVSAANPPEGTHANAGVPNSATLPVADGATREMVVLGDRLFHGQVAGATCTGCHGSGGTGTPLGPNLSANRWLWSDGTWAGIAATIRVGVPKPRNFRSPMPAMGGAQLSAEQVNALAAYIWGLSNANASSPAQTAAPSEIRIPGERLFPESITSAADGRVIIGSIATRQIFVAMPGNAGAQPWIAADNESSLGVYGVFADQLSQTLWACFSLFSDNGTKQAPSALHAYELGSGKLKARYVLPTSGAFCNDIAVGRDGSVYVTDSENMEIDRLKPGEAALKPWAGNGGFGPKGGVLDGISVLGDAVAVNALQSGKVFLVPIGANGSAVKPIEIKLDRPIEQPDGMRAFGQDSVLLVESGGVGRLSLLEIRDGTGHLTTLKEGYPGGPVSVTVVGDTAYVLEGQLDALFEPAAAKHPLTPFHATSLNVGKP